MEVSESSLGVMLRELEPEVREICGEEPGEEGVLSPALTVVVMLDTNIAQLRHTMTPGRLTERSSSLGDHTVCLVVSRPLSHVVKGD